ncbi:hypothetical protein GCM10008015_26680 [Flavobacterium palustre]|uniref:Uncharacterized protein n=1 Tax=Flavobacterium palustre TaxID=1476463 RepID=A0ABQ1HPT5_9FLAO|nr:hypothetical protein [Flavobacterium palustre]GGA84555.1 hypothetical protein GCM10008015_26680 [Flavobacterium palustre]
MKKLLLSLALLIGLITNAQDAEYLNTIKNLSSAEAAIQMTNDLIKDASEPLRLYKSKEFPEYSIFVVQYVPAALTDEEIEKNKEKLTDQFVIFQFKYWNEGEDKNLKITGTKKYAFSDVRGFYLNLFPFWKKHIDASADKEELSKKGYAHKSPYYFSGSNGNWKLKG